MKIVIAGAGSVGIAIAQDLAERHHDVTLLEQRSETVEKARVLLPDVKVLTCDACEVNSLQNVGMRDADVVIAATGDDEDNLVISWLSKQEFAVPRVIARVNNSRNEWLFDSSWGVDVHVSTPALITSLVDEIVEVGSVVDLMVLAGGKMKLVEVTLAANAPAVTEGRSLEDLRMVDGARVVAIVRADQPMVPIPSFQFLEGDHVVVMARPDAIDSLTGAFIAP
ncbi:MAG: NAD-binding protein [Actinomycetota bacterium]